MRSEANKAKAKEGLEQKEKAKRAPVKKKKKKRKAAEIGEKDGGKEEEGTLSKKDKRKAWRARRAWRQFGFEMRVFLDIVL